MSPKAGHKPGAASPGGLEKLEEQLVRKPWSTVEALAPGDLDLVKHMLIEGSTYEDVLEALERRGGRTVTQQALERFFRSSLEVQKGRVRRQLEVVRELKASMGEPEQGQSDMFDAIILTGLMRLNRGDPEIDAQVALHEKAIQKNYDLKRENLRLKNRQEIREAEISKARLRSEAARARAEEARADLLEAKCRGLLESLGEVKQTRQLAPETYQQIKELYGILQTPVALEPGEENSQISA